MTENIKCPCCNNSDEYSDGNGPACWYACMQCGCEWSESKRQPPNAWIACSERPPERYTAVIVNHFRHILAYMDKNGDWLTYSTGEVLEKYFITCWHSLPKPPKPPVTRKAGE